MQFDIAIDGNQAFRFGDGPVSRFETVLCAQVWRNGQLTGLDPLEGHLSGDRLVQVRELPPLPGLWPQYPSLPPGETRPPNHVSILAKVEAGIIALAPEGWQRLTIDCRALVRRMEIEATVTLTDGTVASWSPPVMVGQWLHRLRMREHHAGMGVWLAAHFEFVAGGETMRQFSIEGKPAWQLPISYGDDLQHQADELRLLPRRPEAVPDWMWFAAGSAQQRGRVSAFDVQDDTTTEIVRVFDVIEDGEGVWYRPMVGAREQAMLLHYLENGPLAQAGFHTDGRWVWPADVAHQLREHHVPPALALVDHVRQQRYLVPEVPEIAKSRAAALATGVPWDENQVEAAFRQALTPIVDAILRCQTSPRFYSLDGHRDQAWCLVRDGDWYGVYRADGEVKNERERFGDVRNAVAYLTGQLVVNQDALRYGMDEELPAWQAPYQVLLEQDPGLDEFTGITQTEVTDLIVHRYGGPDGNLLYVDALPDGEFLRYRLKGTWTVLTAIAPNGARACVIPQPIQTYLDTGHVDDLSLHPGLPPVSDDMRAEAARNPDGWLWCADPDIDPRYIEGVPNAVLLGAYKVGPDGELTGETFLNADYVPSPRRRGFPEPLSELDLVLGYIAAGWLPHQRIVEAVLDHNVILETDGAGGLPIGVDQAGRRFMAVYTAPGHVPENARSPMQTTGRSLAPALAGVTLVVNPGAQLGVELPGDDLISALG